MDIPTETFSRPFCYILKVFFRKALVGVLKVYLAGVGSVNIGVSSCMVY